MATKLQWDRSVESDMDHYVVYLDGVKQAAVAQVAAGAIPEWTLPTTGTGSLTVRAVDKSGNISGVSVAIPFDSTPPAVPQNLRLV